MKCQVLLYLKIKKKKKKNQNVVGYNFAWRFKDEVLTEVMRVAKCIKEWKSSFFHNEAHLYFYHAMQKRVFGHI